MSESEKKSYLILRVPRGTIGIKLSLIKEMSVHSGHPSGPCFKHVGYCSSEPPVLPLGPDDVYCFAKAR